MTSSIEGGLGILGLLHFRCQRRQNGRFWRTPKNRPKGSTINHLRGCPDKIKINSGGGMISFFIDIELCTRPLTGDASALLCFHLVGMIFILISYSKYLYLSIRLTITVRLYRHHFYQWPVSLFSHGSINYWAVMSVASIMVSVCLKLESIQAVTLKQILSSLSVSYQKKAWLKRRLDCH